ncbi:uncharacterized protein [Oryctolagus cuniculus]|uniref:uncharacterized protein isoform X2 n=1 Tax=Oryctolagus cuniculus TaxID=9986 RepID=UPI003879E45C
MLSNAVAERARLSVNTYCVCVSQDWVLQSVSDYNSEDEVSSGNLAESESYLGSGDLGLSTCSLDVNYPESLQDMEDLDQDQEMEANKLERRGGEAAVEPDLESDEWMFRIHADIFSCSEVCSVESLDQRSWSFPHHRKLEPHRRRHNSSHGPPHQSSVSSDIKSSPSTSWFHMVLSNKAQCRKTSLAKVEVQRVREQSPGECPHQHSLERNRKYVVSTESHCQAWSFQSLLQQ